MNFIGIYVAMVEISLLLAAILFHKVTRRAQRNQPTTPVTNDRVDQKAPLLAGAEPVNIIQQYRLRDLEVATNNFSDENKLGKGGFGVVYKGMIDGKIVAIKSLHGNSVLLLGDIAREVSLIYSLRNNNLVKLLGFCSEAGHYGLVYEYIPNGDLLGLLNDEEKRKAPNWEKRFKIIEGIAKGLCYLHHNSENVVVHRDLKPENIFLDEHYNPKIADFGLSRVFDTTTTHQRTRVLAGTLGYIPPELYFEQHYSTRSDVYCYGLLVVEMLAGCSIPCYARANQESLTYVMWKQWKNKRPLAEIIDSSLEVNCVLDQITRCYLIGLLCIQHDPKRRPDMELVLRMLSTNVSLPSPSFPGFFKEYTRPQDSSSIMQPTEYARSHNGNISVHPTQQRRHEDASTSELRLRHLNSFDPQPTLIIKEYSFKDLQKVTYNFSHLLWDVGMYKGLLDAQAVVVEEYSNAINAGAVLHILNATGTATHTVERKKRFMFFPVVKKNIKWIISPLRNVNIVTISGYCWEEGHKLFIYKYPSNGSLKDYLYGSVRPEHLEWRIRVNIMRGVANGISYLHHGMQEMQLIHRNIKPGSILLDDLWNPMLCNFENLVNLDKDEEDSGVFNICGTQGYIAPEVFMGCYSRKSDVFSYGITLLEILGNKGPIDQSLNDCWKYSCLQAWANWDQGKILELLYAPLQNSCREEEALRYFQIALLCIQDEPEKRPDMQQVVQMLNSNDPLPIPSAPISNSSDDSRWPISVPEDESSF